MGTFIGHLVPGLAFALLGLWHLLNTIKLYKLKGPSNFISRTWFPFPGLKHFELYSILSFSTLAMAAQVLDFGVAFSIKLDGLEHATMFLHLAIYASVALIAERYSLASDIHNPISCVVGPIAASVLAQEVFLLHYHSTDHVGLEGHYHWLLQLAATVSFLATVATLSYPGNFAAAVVRSASIMAQGIWFVIMGFALWVPRLAPKGCQATPSEENQALGAMICLTEDAGHRAAALANLQFSWMLAGVWILTACLCTWPGFKCMQYNEIGEVDGVK